MTGAKTYAQGKTPWVAVLLSVLIPGVGQFYNGDMKKGGIMLGAAILLGWTVIVWLVVLVWSAIDAYNVASGKAPLW